MELTSEQDRQAELTKARQLYGIGIAVRIAWCQEIARNKLSTQTQLAEEFECSQSTIAQSIAIGRDPRFPQIIVGSDISALPKSMRVLYELTTLDNAGFLELCKPDTTIAVIKDYKNRLNYKPPVDEYDSVYGTKAKRAKAEGQFEDDMTTAIVKLEARLKRLIDLNLVMERLNNIKIQEPGELDGIPKELGLKLTAAIAKEALADIKNYWLYIRVLAHESEWSEDSELHKMRPEIICKLAELTISGPMFANILD